MQQPVSRIDIEAEKKKNTRIAIGIAAFGFVCGIFLYIAMFVAFFAFPFAMFKIIPMPAMQTDMVSLDGDLIIITVEVDFTGASLASEPKEKTLMKKFDGEKLSEPEEIEPFSSMDVSDGKVYLFSEGRYRVFDGSSWEEFDNPAIGGDPNGTVGPDGLWILGRIGDRLVLNHIAGTIVKEVPLPPAMEEEGIRQCIGGPDLLWAAGGLNLFWNQGNFLFHDRFDGMSWSRAGSFKSPASYDVVKHGEMIYLFTHDMGSEIQMRHFDGAAWSDPLSIGVGRGGIILDFDVADFEGKPVVLTQAFFSEELNILEGGGVVQSIPLKSPLKISFPTWMLLINLGFFAFVVLFIFVLSAVINKYKLRYWPLRRGRVYFASVFRRFLAHTIDSVIVSLPLAIAGLVIAIRPFPPDDPFMFVGLVVIAIVGFLLWVYLYYSLFEGLWGWTPGKWICGIKVLRDNFAKCGLGRAFLRNLVRVVDAMFYYFVALVSIGATLKWQRLGDIAAGTVVVRVRRRRKRQLRNQSPRAAGRASP